MRFVRWAAKVVLVGLAAGVLAVSGVGAAIGSAGHVPGVEAPGN